MGRLFGLMANRVDRLRDILHQERAALTVPDAPKPDAWGLGFYQGGEVLHKKRPQMSDGSIEWQKITADVRSDCLIGHLRFATVGNFRAENTHPFRFRQWIFAHHGTIDRFPAMQARMLEAVPDFLRRNIRGDTDSEHLFHVLLSFLHDENQLDNPDVDPRIVLHAIRSAVSMVDRWGREVGANPATLNLMWSNGRHLFALRRGAEMSFVERSGIFDPVDGRASRPDSREAADAASVRYSLVVSGQEAKLPGYRPLEDGTVLTVSRDVHIQINNL